MYRLLKARESDPVRVAVIGAGKFSSMFLAQVRTTPGMRVVGVCDLAPERAQATLRRSGWSDEEIAEIALYPDAEAVIRQGDPEVVVEATGDPVAGVRHALACIAAGRHVVMVNVEADVLAGPLLARRAAEADTVYSLAYGDQPALIVELVDWARICGFEVVCAGKGTKYLPAFHASTPDTVWQHYGISPERAASGGMNARMFNSFLDGTKSAIEMAAVANATGLQPATGGLCFPPCGSDDLAETLKPAGDGGTLPHAGAVEVVSSLQRDGSPVEHDLRRGVFVTFAAPSDYAAACFGEYGVPTDQSGRYAALYRPAHLIGLELGISIASAVLRGEPTGAPEGFAADVVAVAKRDLRAGEVLDGEGGSTVWGRLMPSADSLAADTLPIGLAAGATLKRPIAAGETVTRAGVELQVPADVLEIRREMECRAVPENLKYR
ncbi:MAG: Gfo/Idh/MocA family oxidoreductase [Spirochaetaceae bacterium]|nr:Gfo/Idh/MocA family oxidoreductase [Spirochaetaceae bacterium]